MLLETCEDSVARTVEGLELEHKALKLEVSAGA